MSGTSDLIQYRKEKARETLLDAKILLKDRRLFSAVNRIYYALFYEVVALLLTENLSSSKHSGVRALFNEHFVKTGKVSTDTGRFFSIIFDFRQKSDYGDFVDFEADKVEQWYQQADKFIEELDILIENK